MSAVEQDTRSTRERILDASLAAFAQRGVEATSLDSLAAVIGIRKQTILYWFPSKEVLLLGVIDHAVADLGARLSAAARTAGSDRHRRLVAVVDATFRLGSTNPELLAVVREVARVGPPASAHLADAIAPLVDAAAAALLGVHAPADEPGGHVSTVGDRLALAHVREVLLAAGARVVGMATEAEVRSDLGLPADLAWLRTRRRELLTTLQAVLP